MSSSTNSEDPIYYNGNGEPLPWEAERAKREKKAAFLPKPKTRWTIEAMQKQVTEVWAKEAKRREKDEYDKFAEEYEDGTLQKTLV